MKVEIKKLHPKVNLPTYESKGASGVDLRAFINEHIIINPNTSRIVPTGLSLAIPSECEIQIRPRSGLAAKSNITVLNTPGTIDSDYRGEIKVILFNHGVDKFKIENGDRIAQMVLMPILKFEFEEKSELSSTLRGDGGFGSTGKWIIL